MSRFVKNWETMDILSKIAYLLVGLLFFIIPFAGLVLESFNIILVNFEMLYGLYIVSIIASILARQWKLLLIVSVGTIFVYAVTIGLSEVLWYYLKEWFGIDISYR